MYRSFFKVWVGFMSGVVFTANFATLYGVADNYHAATWKMIAAVMVPILYCLAFSDKN